jgi:hypothetical protein
VISLESELKEEDLFVESLEEVPSQEKLKMINNILNKGLESKLPTPNKSDSKSSDKGVIKSLNIAPNTGENQLYELKKSNQLTKSYSGINVSKSSRMIPKKSYTKSRFTINHSPMEIMNKFQNKPFIKKTISFQQMNLVQNNFSINTKYKMTLLVNLQVLKSESVTQKKKNFFDRNDLRRGSSQIFFRRGDEEDSVDQNKEESVLASQNYLASMLVLLDYCKDEKEFKIEAEKMKKFMLLIQKRFENVD